MDRLIVCGWDEDAAALLETLLAELRGRARLQAVAVGDGHASQLVRARAATQLPCYQHLRELVRGVPHDAVLLGAAGVASEVALTATLSGADLLALGDRLDSESLELVADAAVHHGVALALLRPALRASGLTFLSELVDADPRWTPLALDIELSDQREASYILRDLVAAATRLVPVAPLELCATAGGPDPADPLTLSVQLRYADQSLVTLTARAHRADGGRALRLSGQSEAGAFALDSCDGDSRVTITPWRGEPERSLLRDGNPAVLEAERVATIRLGTSLDARLAHREAAILSAIEAALESRGFEPVQSRGARAVLRLVTGDVDSPPVVSARSGQLHLVTSWVTPA